MINGYTERLLCFPRNIERNCVLNSWIMPRTTSAWAELRSQGLPQLTGRTDGQISTLPLALLILAKSALCYPISRGSCMTGTKRSTTMMFRSEPGSWCLILPGTLQVDLAFVPQTEFRPLGPTFKLIFGYANPIRRSLRHRPRTLSDLRGFTHCTLAVAFFAGNFGKPST